MDYIYHIRGGLRGINLDANLNPTPNEAQGDLYSYKLDYETAPTPQWNGNIGKQSWKANDELRSYSFNYDHSSRLKSASFVGIGSENYSMPNINYDDNGNITNLQRNGLLGTNSYGLMDNLSYTYSGNRLNSVTDAISGNHEVDFVPRGNNAYTYYSNGNLKSDANEQIANIVYNTYLNQPSEVFLTDGRKIKHHFDGGGALFKTEYFNSSGTVFETYHYIDGIIYKNGAFFQIGIPEGRVIYNNGSWQYEFDYKDHLGNTRVSFKAENGVLVKTAKSDFDPFGLVLKSSEINTISNRFEMQGKERDLTFGLNWVNFGARRMNPTIGGRWDKIDPLADHPQQLRFSPYVFSNNNPLRFIDPDGRLPGDLYDQKGNQVGTDNVNDGKNYVVTDKQTVKDLKKSGGVVASAGAVNSAVLLPSNAALQEASNVIDRTEANGGFKEENSIVMKSGQVIQGSTGPMPTIANGEQVANATLPNLPAGSTTANVEATIHSHPTQVQIDNNMSYPQSATLPSPTDRNTFKNYGTNIIVGRLGQSSVSQNPNGSYAVSHQPLGAVIYNSNTQPQIQLTQKAIQKILKTN